MLNHDELKMTVFKNAQVLGDNQTERITDFEMRT
jgi:hypothetical protein